VRADTSHHFGFSLLCFSALILLIELRSVETVVKALNDANVEYIIVGGLAVNAHGFVRMTRNLDLVL
jgi:predicted nucleotidyltransferase